MLCEWSKLTLFQCGGSNLTWFQCGMNGFGSCWVVENDLISVRGLGYVLVFVYRSKLTWFSVRIEVHQGFCRCIEIDLTLEFGIEMV